MASKTIYSESELVIQIRNRNQQAFAYLYDNYSRALFGVIISVVNEETEAEDVLQKVFLKIWDNFQAYDESKGRLYTWMLNIARNSAIDSTRSKYSKMKPKIQNQADNVSDLVNNIGEKENKAEYFGLKEILKGLSEEQREVIDLAYFEGYTQEEISQKLAMPLGTVKTKVRQAIIRLRKLTEKELLQ